MSRYRQQTWNAWPLQASADGLIELMQDYPGTRQIQDPRMARSDGFNDGAPYLHTSPNRTCERSSPNANHVLRNQPFTSPSSYRCSIDSSRTITPRSDDTTGNLDLHFASFEPTEEMGLIRAPESLMTLPNASKESKAFDSMSCQTEPNGSALRCWQHGCNGRSFASVTNYRRHMREKSGRHKKSTCPRCGQEFVRVAARNQHLAQRKCKMVDVDVNGVVKLVPLYSSPTLTQ